MTSLGKLRAFLFSLSGFRISLIVAVLFLVAHSYMESVPRGANGFFYSRDNLLFRLEYAALDAKFAARKVQFEKKVVVAAVDEKSIEQYGLWPWSRNRIAQLVDALNEAGVASIAFDMIFADEDKNSLFRDLTRIRDIYDESGLYRAKQPALLGQVQDRLGEASKIARSLEDEVKPQGKKTLTALNKQLGDVQSGVQLYGEKSQRFYENMTRKIDNVSPDEALAQSIRKAHNKVVMGSFAFTAKEETEGLAPARLQQNFERIKRSATDEVYESVKGAVSKLAPPEVTVAKLRVSQPRKSQMNAIGVQAPIPLLAEAADHFALFNVVPDPDKIIRAMPMVFSLNNMLLPTLPLQAAAVAYGGGFSVQMSQISSDGIEGVWLNDYKETGLGTFIPTEEEGSMLINYYDNPQRALDTYPIVDIIEKKIPADALKGKVILVGATAIGTYDLRATPYAVAPGVYIQAAATQNIMDRLFLQRWSGFPIVEGLLILLFGLIAGLIVPRARPLVSFLVVVSLIAVMITVDYFFVFGNGYWMRIVVPIVELVTIFVGVTIYRFLTEEREKRVIRKAFQFYLSKSVVDSVLKDTSKLKLGGEKRDLTVLFSDIRGFTTISERLQPVDLVHLLNDYLTPMTDLVFHHSGTLDKYMGDAVMAFWGAPVDQPDHATKACITALDMMDTLKQLQATWREKGLPEIDIGIGLNSGPMAVGNMGSTARFDYTVMGDNVNLGSRLEGINKEYGTNIIISEFTYERAKNDVYVRQIDAVRVKGKHEPVRIFELRGRGRPQGEEEQFIGLFEKGIELYRTQKWDAAIATFRECQKIIPTDYCSDKYIHRCEDMKENPPGENWDGVYTMKTK